MVDLDSRIEKALRDGHTALAARGELLSDRQISAACDLFEDRFGPQKLRSLDGEALLELMHAHGTKESLVYWLEFKNDEEFPGNKFGGIGGGSAFKFGLFRRSGQWMDGMGNPISIADAVELARKRRDELLFCADLLEKLPSEADDQTYAQLQKEIEKVAPTIAAWGWAHKYLSLLFQDKLDDYHNQRLQQFYLIKLLQLPPSERGLYACAGRFVRLAKSFGWPIVHFTAVLNEVYGKPINYWRVGIRLGMGSSAQDIWQDMLQGGFAAIGWDLTGDLSTAGTGATLRSTVQGLLATHYYSTDARMASRKAGEIVNFMKKIEEGDIVLAADGNRLRGVGCVTGPYYFDPTAPAEAPHRRKVVWQPDIELKLPDTREGTLTTVWKLKNEDNLIGIEKAMLDHSSAPITPAPPPATKTTELHGIPGRVQTILERKGQVILYGPPGTGKTYWALTSILDLAALQAFGRKYQELSVAEQEEVLGSSERLGLVRVCTFHPAYGYEDFIEGFRPHTSEAGKLVFQQRDGIFKRLCLDARARQDAEFFLLIDEINRGDIPRIFGELLTLLEKDKRGQTLCLPVSGESFSVPPNVKVVGTMNTADRSIALLDTALRRRFGFVELMPDTNIFGNTLIGASLPIGPWLAALNDRIRAHLGRDGRNLQIGHAYLLEDGKPITDLSRFVRILSEDIIPLLEEYCYEDFRILSQILGEGMIHGDKQSIRDELFAPARHEELLQVLLAPAPEILTSAEAVTEDVTPEESDDSETDD